MAPLLDGIDRDELAQSYGDRGFDRLSDMELVQLVASAVARPREAEATSFVLHAPLELMARSALLPFVSADQRTLARQHILNVAVEYEAADDPADLEPAARLPDGVDPALWMFDAIGAGDLEGADAGARQFANRSTAADLVSRLVDDLAARTSAAAHSPIFLYQLERLATRDEISTQLLRPLARELARQPDWRITWFDRGRSTAESSSLGLTEALAQTPLLGSPGSDLIHPLLQQVDTHTETVDLLRESVGRFTLAKARAVQRIAARSMLEDTSAEAPYGWTHCLTIPQAVLGLASRSHDPDRLLAIAATQVAGFRAGLGTTLLDPTELAPSPVDDETRWALAHRLATRAAATHDAHVVKYTLACFDAVANDPEMAGLYLEANQRLFDVWDDLGGDATDPLAE